MGMVSVRVRAAYQPDGGQRVDVRLVDGALVVSESVDGLGGKLDARIPEEAGDERRHLASVDGSSRQVQVTADTCGEAPVAQAVDRLGVHVLGRDIGEAGGGYLALRTGGCDRPR